MELLEAIKSKNHSEWYIQLLSLAMEDAPDISFAIQAADAAYEEMNAPPLFPDETEIEKEDEDADWREEEEPITPVGIPDASLAIHSHDDIENPRAQALLKKALGEASKLSAAGKRDLQAALKVTNPSEQARRIVTFVERYRLQLADLLGGTQLASFLEGMREVARRLPIIPPRGILPTLPPSLSPEQAINLLDKMRALQGMERAEAIYELPPEQQHFVNRGLAIEAAVPQGPAPFTAPKIPEHAPDAIVYPVIDEAAKELSTKNVVTRQEFDALDDAARSKAFTVAGVDATETLTKIRDVMAEQIQKGADVEEFRKAINEAVKEGTFLSDGHLETVFRTNVQGAFSDGQMKVLKHPFVKSGFPYIQYDAIEDDRVRPEHEEMNHRGIQGTNIYRTDDPVIEIFRPPWAYNCRCSWNPISIRQASDAGVKEAQEWLSSGVEPANKAFVAMPPFRPPAQFQRGQLSLEISIQPMLNWMGPVAEPPQQSKKERLKKLRRKLRQRRRVNQDIKFPASWKELKGEMAVHHAPKGGIKIAGQQFKGGEFIPAEVMAKATSEEKSALEGKTSGQQEKSKDKIQPKVKEQEPSEKAKRAMAAHKMVDATIQRYAEEHNEPAFAKAVGGVSFPDSESVDVAIPSSPAMKKQWQIESARYQKEMADWKKNPKGPRPQKMNLESPAEHGIELKTMVDNSNNKITMKRSAMERKAEWERKHKAPMHTVVLDDHLVFNAKGEGNHDPSKRVMYYRRGYGSFRVGTMYRVKDIKELHYLMSLPEKELPKEAQRPKGQKLGRLA